MEQNSRDLKSEASNQSDWGALSAFRKGRDAHGDSTRSFSVFGLFFIILALLGIGYYTYYKAYGAATLNSVPLAINLNSGLVAHWTFDTSAVSGTTVTDMTYRGNNGTLVGSPGTAIGRLGQALSLNGTSQYVNVGNKNIIEAASAASVCLWLKYNASSVTADAGLVTKWDSEGWLIWVDDVAFTSGRTNTISFAVDASQSGPGRVEGSTDLVVPGEWAHYCGTFQGGTFIRLYRNGVLDRENTTSIVSVVDSNTFAIKIGDSANAGSIKYLPGEVDDVRIYNRALSADDVLALYELGERTKINTTVSIPQFDASLVGHWTFDGSDIKNATATDVSSSGNDGVITGGTSFVIGKLGQALSLDGTSGHVQTYGSSTLYQFPNSTFTVSGWLKKSDTTNGYIVTQGACSGGWGVYMLSGTLRFRLKAAGSCGGDAASRNTATTNLNDGEWHHFAAVVTTDTVVSANNDVTMYIDGVLDQGSVSRNGSPYGTTATNLLVGLSSGAGGYFSGAIDGIQIYNRALSANEVAQLYTLGGGSKIEICRESAVQDADGNWYNTIAIGSQCWLDRNMNVGTRINASTNQTNNGTIEKYCYSNSDANCTTNNPNKPDGGLYQWNEAMQYSIAEGAQGICPSGFHIPTDAEWHTLEKFLTDSGQSCLGNRNGSQSCASAGTKLQPGGSSRFEGNSGGFTDGGSSGDRGALGYWWSSTQSDGTAFNRAISASGVSVYRLADSTTLAESVRCVQD